jgi:hypothetical protein
MDTGAGRRLARPELQVDLGAGTERCPDPVHLRQYVADDIGYDPFAHGAKGSAMPST